MRLLAFITLGLAALCSGLRIQSLKKACVAGLLGVGLCTMPELAQAAPVGSVVVLGASGKTGAQVVKILASQGVKVQPAYARETADRFQGVENVYPPIVADVTKPESLASALSGANAVVFAASASGKGGNAEAVDFHGVENTARASIDDGVKRLVIISSAAITRPDSLGYKVTNLFGGIMGYKFKGEEAARALYLEPAGQKLSLAIIRPGGLLDGKALGPKEMELNQGDSIAGEVNRADVAECAAAAAISTSLPQRVTFEISEAGRSGPLEGGFKTKSGYEQSGKDSYDELFKGLKIDFNRLEKE